MDLRQKDTAKTLEERIRSAVSELHYCTGAYRISPTDVNSRPSSCLTNFLLNGKIANLSKLSFGRRRCLKLMNSSCRSIGAAGAAQEVGVKGHQPHAQQPRGRDLPARAQQQPLHPGGPALHQRGLRGPGDRLPHHGTPNASVLSASIPHSTQIFSRISASS